ncbi:hypothetical protein [Fimbriiglobus ruber]|uniref:hypothetical protein n=1 Tax=Fimbriiglobus ruber TaxID=1908690 RepID=UPI000B4ABF89|nr:hypothetical protein [Fimbriiglobus ruber]
MPFADADAFWKSPNVYDVATAAGFVLGLVSIWLSWWLAKRDIEKRLKESADRAVAAARDEVRQIAQTLLFAGVSDAAQFFKLAQEANRAKQWQRSIDLCQLGSEHLSRLIGHQAITDDMRLEFRRYADDIKIVIAKLRDLSPRKGTLPPEVADALENTLRMLNTIDGRLRSIRPEVGNG